MMGPIGLRSLKLEGSLLRQRVGLAAGASHSAMEKWAHVGSEKYMALEI